MNSYRHPNAQWLGSPNFSPDREGHNLDADPRWIIMHTMVGTWQSANGRFQQSAQKASAHYGVCLDGSLKQWVDEKDASWAAGNYTVNLDAINIEHEDAGDYNGPRTPALYAASTHLVADICRRYGIPCDRAHIRLHKEVSDAPTGCPDSLDVDGIVHTAQALLGGDMDATDPNFQALIWRVKALIDNEATISGGPQKGQPNALHAELEAIKLALKAMPAGSAPSYQGTVTLNPK